MNHTSWGWSRYYCHCNRSCYHRCLSSSSPDTPMCLFTRSYDGPVPVQGSRVSRTDGLPSFTGLDIKEIVSGFTSVRTELVHISRRLKFRGFIFGHGCLVCSCTPPGLVTSIWSFRRTSSSFFFCDTNPFEVTLLQVNSEIDRFFSQLKDKRISRTQSYRTHRTTFTSGGS